MARRQRLRPEPTIAEMVRAINELPAFSIISTTDGPNSAETADAGTLAFDVGSSNTTFWMKESGSGNTGWGSIATHGYVDSPPPAYSIIHSYESTQPVPNGASGADLKFENFEGTSNVSPTGDGYPYTVLTSEGTYLCTFTSSFSASGANNEWEFHFRKNGALVNFCGYVTVGAVASHHRTTFSMLTYFASNDSVAINAVHDAVGSTDYNTHHHSLVIHRV